MDRLIKALQNPALFDHPVDKFSVIETHISRVLLTGRYAYKIKKPVNFGFLDFSTLEKRKHLCEEELRLNKRLAPSTYLGVVAITGTPDNPHIDSGPDSKSPVIEYAIKMKEFPQHAQLDHLLATGELNLGHMDQIATVIARFHQQTEITNRGSTFGTADKIRQPVNENFSQLSTLLTDERDRSTLETLSGWCDREFARLSDEFANRKKNGFVRECHGDMHLRNMALIDSEILIFDCIEFSEDLRKIDVISEVAFLVMDLHARNKPALAARFINRYLELSGDYPGLIVMRFYLVYRAMVRAKVEAIRAHQADISCDDVVNRSDNNNDNDNDKSNNDDRDQALTECHRYLDLALQYIHPPPNWLLITHGLSGSGKTFFTQQLLQADSLEIKGAIRIRSDVERKRLFKPNTGIGADIYKSAATVKTYQTLLEIAGTLLLNHWPVIVDATFIDASRRDLFQTLASRLRVPFVILELTANESTLRERITARMARQTDASDATLTVLESQLKHWQALSPSEKRCALVIDNENTDSEKAENPEQILARLQHLLKKSQY